MAFFRVARLKDKKPNLAIGSFKKAKSLKMKRAK
jgi:hypothetical protein